MLHSFGQVCHVYLKAPMLDTKGHSTFERFPNTIKICAFSHILSLQIAVMALMNMAKKDFVRIIVCKYLLLNILLFMQ